MGSTQHEGVDDDDDDEGEPERFNIAAVHGGGEDNAGRRDDNAIGDLKAEHLLEKIIEDHPFSPTFFFIPHIYK